MSFLFKIDVDYQSLNGRMRPRCHSDDDKKSD